MMVSSLHDGRSQAIPMQMPNTFANAGPYNQQQQQQQQQPQQQHTRRKRKADTQDTNNERLSKRLSLLNLEQNGSKLYVPVEQSQIPRPPPSITNNAYSPSSNAPPPTVAAAGDELMHLDDTNHKVYIYNLDDELSSESEPDTDPEGKLVFLPDVERHLRENRLAPGAGAGAGARIGSSIIPRPIAPNKDGELAGMQLVLYNDGPSSLTVPEEQDSVRKAIIEARARVRQRQQDEREEREVANNPLMRRGTATFATPVRVVPPTPSPSSPATAAGNPGWTMGEASCVRAEPVVNTDDVDDDADAMDID